VISCGFALRDAPPTRVTTQRSDARVGSSRRRRDRATDDAQSTTAAVVVHTVVSLHSPLVRRAKFESPPTRCATCQRAAFGSLAGEWSVEIAAPAGQGLPPLPRYEICPERRGFCMLQVRQPAPSPTLDARVVVASIGPLALSFSLQGMLKGFALVNLVGNFSGPRAALVRSARALTFGYLARVAS